MFDDFDDIDFDAELEQAILEAEYLEEFYDEEIEEN